MRNIESCELIYWINWIGDVLIAFVLLILLSIHGIKVVMKYICILYIKIFSRSTPLSVLSVTQHNTADYLTTGLELQLGSLLDYQKQCIKLAQIKWIWLYVYSLLDIFRLSWVSEVLASLFWGWNNISAKYTLVFLHCKVLRFSSLKG